MVSAGQLRLVSLLIGPTRQGLLPEGGCNKDMRWSLLAGQCGLIGLCREGNVLYYSIIGERLKAVTKGHWPLPATLPQ